MRARKLHYELTQKSLGKIILWDKEYCSVFCPKRPLLDIESPHWGTSWDMISCWNGSDRLTIEEGKKIKAMHIAQFACIIPRGLRHDDTFVTLPSVYKGMAMPADLFDVADQWLIDTGCPKDLAPDSCKTSHPDSV